MSDKYNEMDVWTDEQIADFKENAKDVPSGDIQIQNEGYKSISGMLVAEGDSWFDYFPGTDLIDCLKNHHGYSIKNTAKAGDTLENMIYGTGIDNEFRRAYPTITTVLRQIEKYKPKAFLFSGGGNDIAGDEFASFLNHKGASLSNLRLDYVESIVGTVFRKYFVDLIRKVSEKSPNTHIVTHGYGHTVPTGKGVKVFFATWSGPWLRPALAMKGIFDSAEQIHAVEHMINAYNDMLQELDGEFEQFHHVDLRQAIDPQNDWKNELHLKNSAFARVADLIHQRIQSIGVVPS